MEQTPIQKAKELKSKFTFIKVPESEAKFYNPTQCALIMVDELIKETEECGVLGLDRKRFFQEVKQELYNQ